MQQRTVARLEFDVTRTFQHVRAVALSGACSPTGKAWAADLRLPYLFRQGCCCATAQNERVPDSLFRRYNTSRRRLICIRLTCSDRAAAERGNDAEQARVQRPVRTAGDGGRLPGAPHAHRRRPQRCIAFVYISDQPKLNCSCHGWQTDSTPQQEPIA